MRRTPLVLVSLVFVLLAGCGSNSSTAPKSSTTTSSNKSAPLSAAQFVSKANALCRQGNTKIAQLSGPAQIQITGSAPSGAAESHAQMERVAATADRYNMKLRALKPPSKQAAAYARFLAAYERQAAKLHRLAKASGTMSVVMIAVPVVQPDGSQAMAGVILPAAAEPDRVASSRIARGLGLKACTGSTSGGAPAPAAGH